MTIFQEIQAGTIPARMTVAELYALTEAGVVAENEKIELIDGEVVPMAAAKARFHERMKNDLNRFLVLNLPEEARLKVESSITFEALTLLEPDLCVMPKGMETTDARGPDLLLVIEVADSSLPYDVRVKAPLYARFGVRDYWVVDAVRRTIRTHRAPMDGRYTDVVEYSEDQPVAPLLFPDLPLRLDVLD